MHARRRLFTTGRSQARLSNVPLIQKPWGVATIEKLGWDPKSLTVKDDYNRWLVVPAATANHLCLGSIFAWSVFNQPLMRMGGVVVPAPNDWSLGDINVSPNC